MIWYHNLNPIIITLTEVHCFYLSSPLLSPTSPLSYFILYSMSIEDIMQVVTWSTDSLTEISWKAWASISFALFWPSSADTIRSPGEQERSALFPTSNTIGGTFLPLLACDTKNLKSIRRAHDFACSNEFNVMRVQLFCISFFTIGCTT